MTLLQDAPREDIPREVLDRVAQLASAQQSFTAAQFAADLGLLDECLHTLECEHLISHLPPHPVVLTAEGRVWAARHLVEDVAARLTFRKWSVCVRLDQTAQDDHLVLFRVEDGELERQSVLDLIWADVQANAGRPEVVTSSEEAFEDALFTLSGVHLSTVLRSPTTGPTTAPTAWA